MGWGEGKRRTGREGKPEGGKGREGRKGRPQGHLRGGVVQGAAGTERRANHQPTYQEKFHSEV